MNDERAVDRFLGAYPPEVQEIAARARTLVLTALRALPHVDETVDAAARLVAYGCGPGYAGMVCTLIPSRTEVKLGFYRGAELPDPRHLLEGTGKVHRHVRLRGAKDVAMPGLNALLKAAVAAWTRRHPVTTRGARAAP
jgi:hypothetical protein